MKKEIKMVDKFISAVALASAKSNVNSTCSWFFHQTKVPDSVKKLRKF
ncbi:cyclic lactone autoinducer peptide [Eubacterium sp.]|jgi:cyclic lactone autoinducer peptide|nr:cyclic lactone autoinducer peptide [Eubacterium sp.]MBS5621145.1 cyclic lactone autoinducer peptide [Eubacterium sp.]